MREKYWLNAEDKKNEIKEHHLFQEKCSKEGPKRSPLRDRLQNTPKPSIPLVVNNVIPSTDWRPKTAIMYHLGEGTRPCPFAVMANGHGRVMEPVSLSLDLDLFGDDP